MTLDNGLEAALPIAEISGWLKIVIKRCWVLRLAFIDISRHGLILRCEPIIIGTLGGRLVPSFHLETD